MSFFPPLPPYLLLAEREVDGHLLLVFQNLKGSIVATLSKLGQVTLRIESNQSSPWLIGPFLSSPDASFLCLKDGKKMVVAYDKLSGGGCGQSRTRPERNESQLQQFVSGASSTTTAASSVLFVKASEAAVTARSLEGDVQNEDLSALGQKAEVLKRLAIEKPPQDPYIVVQHLVNAIASPFGEGMNVIIKTQLASVLHTYVDQAFLKYAIRDRQKVLGETKKDIYQKLAGAISLAKDKPEHCRLLHHLEAAQSGLYSLDDTTPFMMNTMSELLVAVGGRNVGLAIVVLKKLVAEKNRVEHLSWFIDLATVRYLVSQEGAYESDTILNELLDATKECKDWLFLFGAIDLLASFMAKGKSKAIRNQAFSAFLRFTSFDEFLLKNNWRMRFVALEGMIKLYRTVDPEMQQLIKEELLKREALELDERVRSLFSQMRDIEEITQAWGELLKDGKYEDLLVIERTKLSSSMAQLEKEKASMVLSDYLNAMEGFKRQQTALDSRQEALEKEQKALSLKVDKLAVQQRQTEQTVAILQSRLDARENYYNLSLPPYFRVPKRNKYFYGRTELLTTVKRLLSTETDLTQRVVLKGPGGVGKAALTNIVVDDVKGRFKLVWWVRGYKVNEDLRDLALTLPLGLSSKTPEEKLLRPLKEYLQNNGDWLIAFVGFENLKAIPDVIPEKGGRIIVTTTDDSVDGIKVPPLPSEEAEGLFINLTKMRDREGLDKLAALLLNFPLAIHLASCFIRRNQISYSDFYNNFVKKAGTYQLATTSQVIEIIWGIIKDYLLEKSPFALRMIQQTAFFDCYNIPGAFLVDPKLPALETISANQLVRLLGEENLGILSSGNGDLAFLISPLLQEAMRKTFAEEERLKVLGEASLTLAKRWEFSIDKTFTYEDAKFYAPHAEVFCFFAEKMAAYQSQVSALKRDLAFIKTL